MPPGASSGREAEAGGKKYVGRSARTSRGAAAERAGHSRSAPVQWDERRRAPSLSGSGTRSDRGRCGTHGPDVNSRRERCWPRVLAGTALLLCITLGPPQLPIALGGATEARIVSD